MPPRLLFAYLFRALALGVGIPSLASTLYFGWASIQLRLNDPGPLPPSTGSSNQLLSLIETTARAAGSIFQWLGNLGEWLVTIVFAISLIAFLFALLLWFTATGLAQGKLWARITAVFCGLAFLSIIGTGAILRSALR
jgi:hypothetical protein